jgi:hypothetical protein
MRADMAEPQTPPLRLLAVYETDDEARRIARRLADGGVVESEIRVDEPLDHVVSVTGEMREEMDRTIAGPGNVGPFTPKMRKGMSVGTAVGAGVGLLCALPFAAIGFGGWPLWLRLIIVAIVGVSAGATVGWVVGGGFGSERPEEELAAEHGVTLSVPATKQTEALLSDTGALRIDLVDEVGNPVRPVESQPDESTARHVGRNIAQEEQRG